jgi:hypothetical protein
MATAGCQKQAAPVARETPHATAEPTALAAAESWLDTVDKGDFGKSWDDAATTFKAVITRGDWDKALQSVRQPLGKVISRKITFQRRTKTLPGAPDGDYVTIQYETAFENKANAFETVTPMLDKDGQWRVSGYYVK